MLHLGVHSERDAYLLHRARQASRIGVIALMLNAVTCGLPARGQSSTTQTIEAEIETVRTTIVKALTAAKSASQGGKLGLYSDGSCVLGAFLRQGETITVKTTLQADTSYVFVAVGDDNAVDVDVAVRSEAGVRLTSDTDENKTAVTGYRPQRSGDYQVGVHLYKSKGDSFCVLIRLQAGESFISEDSVSQALARLATGSSELASSAVQRGARGLTLKHGDRDWVVFGAVLEPQDKITYKWITPGRGRSHLFSCGDDSTTNIDTVVLDEDEETIGEEEADHPTSLVTWNSAAKASYRIRFSLVSTRAGRSFVVAAVFKEK